MNVTLNAKSNNLNETRATTFSLPWTLHNTLLLIIYIAPRGILEIYHLLIKHRLGALLFHPNGKLLYHLSLFEQAKNNNGDPSHIFLCDYHKKQQQTQSASTSTFSLPSFKTATAMIDDIDLDKFNDEDLKFDGTMYELKLTLNEEEIKAQQNDDKERNGMFLFSQNQLTPSKSRESTTSSTGRYSPITFIHPTNSTKVSYKFS